MTVVAFGRGAGKRAYSALAYHHGVAGVVAVAGGGEGEGAPPVPSGVWTAIPNVPGAFFAVGRDRSGRIIWVAASCGGKKAVSADSLGEGQLSWRLEGGFPGHDADLFVMGFRTREPPSGEMMRLLEPAAVLVKGRMDGALPPRWHFRSAFGAVMVDESGISGYDGERWVRTPPASR